MRRTASVILLLTNVCHWFCLSFKTEPIGKLAIGIKDSLLNSADLGRVSYIIFHYCNNDKATPYKLLSTPKLVSKQDIPDGYLLRMGVGAEKFILLDYNPAQPYNIGSFDIMKVQRKGKGYHLNI